MFINYFTGAEKLMRHLDKHKVPMALATGSGHDEFQLKSQHHTALFQMVSHSVFSSSDPEVKHGKPAPDCFLVAAKRFAGTPSGEKVSVSMNNAQG